MNILFLCTGNSCRSQMAEGWSRTLAADHRPDELKTGPEPWKSVYQGVCCMAISSAGINCLKIASLAPGILQGTR